MKWTLLKDFKIDNFSLRKHPWSRIHHHHSGSIRIPFPLFETVVVSLRKIYWYFERLQSGQICNNFGGSLDLLSYAFDDKAVKFQVLLDDLPMLLSPLG